MFPGLIKGMFDALPSQCMVCQAWPAQPVCEACVNRFAQPQPRCQTCALPLPIGVGQCGMCLKAQPPLDACLAAVSYAYPWSDLILGFKFHKRPGRAGAFALLLRSTPRGWSPHWTPPMRWFPCRCPAHACERAVSTRRSCWPGNSRLPKPIAASCFASRTRHPRVPSSAPSGWAA